MPLEEALTRWTVRVAVVLYLLSLLVWLQARGRLTLLGAARAAWTAGCVAFMFHVVCAFQFYHHWSHAAAYEATARRSAEVVGLAWGGGLYANYLFGIVWLVDVAWWWRGLEAYRDRPRLVDWAIHLFLAFIVFNATVVFGAGLARWLGVAGCLLAGCGAAVRSASSVMAARRG